MFAGKSSLCACILGELSAVSAPARSRMHTAGKVAYVAQQPFILNTSLKQVLTAPVCTAVALTTVALGLHIKSYRVASCTLAHTERPVRLR